MDAPAVGADALLVERGERELHIGVASGEGQTAPGAAGGDDRGLAVREWHGVERAVEAEVLAAVLRGIQSGPVRIDAGLLVLEGGAVVPDERVGHGHDLAEPPHGGGRGRPLGGVWPSVS